MYQEKAKGIEKWVTAEKNEIKQKRAKVKDTCTDIGSYLAKIDQDKRTMLDVMASGSSCSPRGKGGLSYRSDSQDSPSVSKARDQLRGIKEGRIGGAKPETRYLNKKREYVRELMKEKQQAVERGVRDKISNYESEMIDEMLQAAIKLNVDDEVDRRVEIARKLVEDGQIEESVGQQSSPY